MSGNTAREGGGAIFFVVDADGGTLTIDDSTLSGNPSGAFQNAGHSGMEWQRTARALFATLGFRGGVDVFRPRVRGEFVYCSLVRHS